MRFQELYFLDGISGGNGFLLPGETIAANACFTCEKTPLTEAWDSLEFEAGIGLGLAITRQVIEQHQGRLDVSSEPGKGSTFVLTLRKWK